MKIEVTIKVIYDEGEDEQAFELIDELYSYEQEFADEFEDHEVSFNVSDHVSKYHAKPTELDSVQDYIKHSSLFIMQGLIGVNGRFKSKKAAREAIQAGETVSLEATSIFGNEYGGDIYTAPDGDYFVVGPCPRTSRKWYAKISKRGDTIKVT